jgi:hypothetical protein
MRWMRASETKVYIRSGRTCELEIICKGERTVYISLLILGAHRSIAPLICRPCPLAIDNHNIELGGIVPSNSKTALLLGSSHKTLAKVTGYIEERGWVWNCIANTREKRTQDPKVDQNVLIDYSARHQNPQL